MTIVHMLKLSDFIQKLDRGVIPLYNTTLIVIISEALLFRLKAAS